MARKFLVHYRSRHNKLDRHMRYVRAESKEQIREKWHDMMNTDEYLIKKIVEVQE